MNHPNSLPPILQQIAQIQSMERGKLSVIKESASGPFYKLQARENGKNVTRYVPREQVPAVQEALNGYKQFQALTRQYVDEVITHTRTAIAAGSKKKTFSPRILRAQEQEIDQLIVWFQASTPRGVDVQKLEVLVRTAIFKPATALVGFLLQAAAERIDATYQSKPGEQCKGRQPVTVDCIFGSFTLERPVPILYVSADATGVPMRKEELEGRKGKQPDGTAKTRSVYLGCVFTQHRRDEEGHPVRDHESTTYVSGMHGIEEFGPMLRQEAIRRNMGQAGKVVLLMDGALGLEKMGQLNFPGATQIVDFWHGADHAGQVVEALLGSKAHPLYNKQRRRFVRRLLSNGVESLINESRQECAGKANEQAVEEQLAYLVHNVPRMKYRTFRRQGFFIGSGVVEAGCKTVIGSRCKQSGMFWGRSGVQNVLALRCVGASRRIDAFWKDRLNTLAARNDCLSIAA